jgi:hypothetical protein
VTSLSINQFLYLYSWFPLAALIFIVLLIARFYQNFSGERTYFSLYVIPLVLFGASAVRYASLNQVAGDMLADLFSGTAGIVLLYLSVLLFRLMMTGRK